MPTDSLTILDFKAVCHLMLREYALLRLIRIFVIYATKSRIHNLLITVTSKRLPISSCQHVQESALPRKKFDKLLLKAIDEGLSSMGESSKHAVYFHIEKSFNIRRDEIPCRIEDFAKAIEGIFGLGAHFVEIVIMKRLHERIGGGFKWPESSDFTFVEYLAAAKRDFTQKNNHEDPVQYESMEAPS